VKRFKVWCVGGKASPTRKTGRGPLGTNKYTTKIRKHIQESIWKGGGGRSMGGGLEGRKKKKKEMK